MLILSPGNPGPGQYIYWDEIDPATRERKADAVATPGPTDPEIEAIEAASIELSPEVLAAKCAAEIVCARRGYTAELKADIYNDVLLRLESFMGRVA